jgi:hypothetical protein
MNGLFCKTSHLDLDTNMSKKNEKATLTSAEIEEQTAAFLKAGGSVESVGKGQSGPVSSPGSKQISRKK